MGITYFCQTILLIAPAIMVSTLAQDGRRTSFTDHCWFRMNGSRIFSLNYSEPLEISIQKQLLLFRKTVPPYHLVYDGTCTGESLNSNSRFSSPGKDRVGG